MAGRNFEPARGGVPRIQGINAETGETFKYGALVVINLNGNVQECAANPTSVTGVAQQPAFTGPGYDISDASKTVVFTGRSSAVSVALAGGKEEFTARGVNGGTDPVIPLQTHIGQQYGVIKMADGSWAINIADQVNALVEITDISVAPEPSLFYCKFLPGVLVTP